MLRWGAVKPYEGRPSVEDVVAASPFESIRSAEIGPLFDKNFRILYRLDLGGTIQHLLYNGIVHNFRPGDPESRGDHPGDPRAEDALIDFGMLPSDFQLLVGATPDRVGRRLAEDRPHRRPISRCASVGAPNFTMAMPPTKATEPDRGQSGIDSAASNAARRSAGVGSSGMDRSDIP